MSGRERYSRWQLIELWFEELEYIIEGLEVITGVSNHGLKVAQPIQFHKRRL
jgi:hypothetical protein